MNTFNLYFLLGIQFILVLALIEAVLELRSARKETQKYLIEYAAAIAEHDISIKAYEAAIIAYDKFNKEEKQNGTSNDTHSN